MMDGDPCILQNSHKVYQTGFGNMQEYRNMMSGCFFFHSFSSNLHNKGEMTKNSIHSDFSNIIEKNQNEINQYWP